MNPITTYLCLAGAILTEAVSAYCEFCPSLEEEQVAALQECIGSSLDSPSLQLLLGKPKPETSTPAKKTKAEREQSKRNAQIEVKRASCGQKVCCYYCYDYDYDYDYCYCY